MSSTSTIRAGTALGTDTAIRAEGLVKTEPGRGVYVAEQKD